MPTPIRLFLADDHALFSSALAQLLGAHDDLEVVGTATTAREAVEGVGVHRPDVLLLDVEMPGPGVQVVVQTLRRLAPELRILILSMYDHPPTVQAVLGLGARGYLLKSASAAELVSAVRRVVDDPEAVVLSVSAKLFTGAANDAQQPTLSQRELQIMTLAAQAFSNSQIASRLQLKESTVKRHMHNIFSKVGAISRLDAVNKVRAAGLIDVDGEHPRH